MSKELDGLMKKLKKKSDKEWKKREEKFNNSVVQDTLMSDDTKRMVTYALLGSLWEKSRNI